MTESVMVFSPGPLLTVTIERHGRDNDLHLHTGGQGVWQARMISSLGGRVVLCTALGGEVGVILAALLADEDFEVRAVRRGFGSGWYVSDRREGGRKMIADHPGAPLSRHELDGLYNTALAAGLRSSVCVLSAADDPNVVPPDTYRRLAADLSGSGARVVVDLAGEYLTAALAGGVTFLKISHDELIREGRAADDSVASLSHAAHQLRAAGARSVVISRANKPALALLDDELVQVEVPSLQEADARGAGDSMTAAVATVLSQGGDLTEAVRTGAAAGAVNVTRHGLGTGQAETIAALVERVRLAPLRESSP